MQRTYWKRLYWKFIGGGHKKRLHRITQKSLIQPKETLFSPSKRVFFFPLSKYLNSKFHFCPQIKFKISNLSLSLPTLYSVYSGRPSFLCHHGKKKGSSKRLRTRTVCKSIKSESQPYFSPKVKANHILLHALPYLTADIRENWEHNIWGEQKVKAQTNIIT